MAQPMVDQRSVDVYGLPGMSKERAGKCLRDALRARGMALTGQEYRVIGRAAGRLKRSSESELTSILCLYRSPKTLFECLLTLAKRVGKLEPAEALRMLEEGSDSPVQQAQYLRERGRPLW